MRAVGLSVLGLVLALAPARGDLFTLTIDHCTGGCGTSPFGTIDVTQLGANTVHVVIALNNAAKFILTGQAGSTVGFNLVGNPSISLSNATLPGWSLDSSTAGSLQFDGFGDFEYSLNCCNNQNGGANAQAGNIAFDLTGTGLTPTSFQELSTGGAPSVFFAVDELSAQTGNTGPIGSNTVRTTVVPEPGSMLLLLTAIGGTVFSLKKKRFNW